MNKLALTLAAFLLPTVAFAQNDALNIIDTLINRVYPIIFAVAILFFLFQLAMFLLNSGEKKDEAKSGMIWGIIILIVMFSIGGIVAIFQDTFELGSNNNLETPTINVGNGGINL